MTSVSIYSDPSFRETWWNSLFHRRGARNSSKSCHDERKTWSACTNNSVNEFNFAAMQICIRSGRTKEKRIQLKWNSAGSDAWNVFRKGWKIRAWWLFASSLLVFRLEGCDGKKKTFRTFCPFLSPREIYERIYNIFSNSMKQYFDT